MRFLIIFAVVTVSVVAVGAGYLNMKAEWEANPEGMEGMEGMSDPTVAMGAPLDDPVAGKAIYLESCAACHGANLEGQPNWQSPDGDGVLPAPPHDRTGHTWHHGDDLLFNYTKLGGQGLMDQLGVPFNSGMPGFADQLSDQQIRDVLAYIKSTWPDRERQAQAQRSEAERLEEEENK